MGSFENPTGRVCGAGTLLCSALVPSQHCWDIAGTLLGYIWGCAMWFSISLAVCLSRKRIEEEGTQILNAGISVLDFNFSEGLGQQNLRI